MNPPLDRLETLYRDHAPACFGYARALCGGDVQSAEDLVHDVFARLLGQPERPAGMAGNAMSRSYLLTAVRNAAINRHRDAGRRRRHEQQAAGQPWFEEQAFGEVELIEQLLAVPAEQREVIYLKIWADQTFAQIAEVIGAPLQTVASRFRLGLGKLRGSLEAQDG
jgi:RNA polymerase sigma-70 factor (ECF subfamily)